jgi:hypothetical protein
MGQSPYPRQFIPIDGKKISYTSFGLKTRRAGDPVLVFEAGFGAGLCRIFPVFFPPCQKNNVPPPYILIGHSLGRPYIRLFTFLYSSPAADPAGQLVVLCV